MCGGGRRRVVHRQHVHLMNKMAGRIGDSPMVGSRMYTCDFCGVSCTGEGEAIIWETLVRPAECDGGNGIQGAS